MRPTQVRRPAGQAKRHPVLVGPVLRRDEADAPRGLEPEPRVVRRVADQDDHRPAERDGFDRSWHP